MALPAHVAERVRSEFAGPLAELEANAKAGPEAGTALDPNVAAEKRESLRKAAIGAARRRLVKLHRERDISDEIAQTLLRELDFDELRVSGARSVD
jgi:hypothetical protein